MTVGTLACAFRTQRIADGFRVVPTSWDDVKNMRPARPLAGLANHLRTSRLRVGKAWSSTPACRATARRTVRSSGSTRSRPTDECLPSEPLSGHHGSQADLDVKGPQRSLKRSQLCLYLDDQQRSRPGVPSQDVDGTSISESGEGHLEFDLPSQLAKHIADGANQRGVAFVEQSVERGTVPFSEET